MSPFPGNLFPSASCWSFLPSLWVCGEQVCEASTQTPRPRTAGCSHPAPPVHRERCWAPCPSCASCSMKHCAPSSLCHFFQAKAMPREDSECFSLGLLSTDSSWAALEMHPSNFYCNNINEQREAGCITSPQPDLTHGLSDGFDLERRLALHK